MKLSPEGTNALVCVRAVFSHQQQLSAVMFDRAKWFIPIYDCLAKDSFHALCLSRDEFMGKEALVEAPVRYALGYAHTAFFEWWFEQIKQRFGL